jgi:hypothetical protein
VQSRFFRSCPLSILGRNEKKKTGQFFDKKTGEISQSFIKRNFVLFQKFKFIHFTEALEIVFNEISTGNVFQLFVKDN